jgi:uncharacterized Zn finger protein
MIAPLDTWMSALGVGGDANGRRRIRNAERRRSAGRVISVRAMAGRIEGRVQGSHARPHLVELGVPQWTASQWRAVIDVLARQARQYARLLAGQLPEQFDEVLSTLDLSLIPQPHEWRLGCTCGAPAPCVHQTALWLQVREQLDVDPYLLTRVRGRSREQLLAEIRDQRAGGMRDRLELSAFATRGWSSAGTRATEIPLPFVRAPRTSAGPLRMLGDPPGWAGPTSAAALFAPAVEAAAQRAVRLLDDDADASVGDR